MYEIKLNGKSTGLTGSKYSLLDVLQKMHKNFDELMDIVEENTGYGEIDQNYYHNVNVRHLTYTHQNRNSRTSRTGVYKNAYCKTIAPNNTGKKVFGFDGYVDVWKIEKIS